MVERTSEAEQEQTLGIGIGGYSAGEIKLGARYENTKAISARIASTNGDHLGQKVFYPAGSCYIGLAGVYLEWYESEKAEETIQRGMELCRVGGMDGLYTGSILKARLRQARGDVEGALEEIQLLKEAFQRRDFTLAARQVSIQLAVGDIASASLLIPPLRTMINHDLEAPSLPLIAIETFKIILARILLAQGETGQRSELLDEIQATAEPGRRSGRLIEIRGRIQKQAAYLDSIWGDAD